MSFAFQKKKIPNRKSADPAISVATVLTMPPSFIPSRDENTLSIKHTKFDNLQFITSSIFLPPLNRPKFMVSYLH